MMTFIALVEGAIQLTHESFAYHNRKGETTPWLQNPTIQAPASNIQYEFSAQLGDHKF